MIGTLFYFFCQTNPSKKTVKTSTWKSGKRISGGAQKFQLVLNFWTLSATQSKAMKQTGEGEVPTLTTNLTVLITVDTLKILGELSHKSSYIRWASTRAYTHCFQMRVNWKALILLFYDRDNNQPKKGKRKGKEKRPGTISNPKKKRPWTIIHALFEWTSTITR